MSRLKRKWKTASVGEDVEKWDPVHVAAGNAKHPAAVENNLAVPQKVQIGLPSSLGTRERWWLHSIINVPNATELNTFKGLILCYVNFESASLTQWT